MSLRDALAVVAALEADGVIGRWAITGAVAALHYLEPALTRDIDILVSFDNSSSSPSSGLVTLGPILTWLAARGYSELRDEGIVVAGWPIQFIPVAGDLDAEALAQALDIDGGVGSMSRVLRPEHLVAKALEVGRPKDRSRILHFLEEDAVDHDLLAAVLRRHGLVEKWRAFCLSTGSPVKLGLDEP